MSPPSDEMETFGDLLARDRRSDDPAVRVPGAPTVEYTYDDLVTTAWKTANFFSHRGVHPGATVAVVDDHAVPAVLALFGAAQLGATTRFVDPMADGDDARSGEDAGVDARGAENAGIDARRSDDASRELDARLLVGPGAAVLAYDLPAGATRVAYTADGVADSAVEAFGRSVWSENPVEPPESVDPDAPALSFDGGRATHRELLAAARDAAGGLDPGGEVVVRASLTRRDAVVEGVLAPILAGGTVVLGEAESTDAAFVVE